jgi:hypothetical protein
MAEAPAELFPVPLPEVQCQAETMKVQTHAAKPRKRTIRFSKQATARTAIGELAPGCELFIFTFGQFSLIDALCALLEKTGPAHVTISTWTAATADLERSEKLLRAADILSMRYIVDRSFLTRKPQYCRAMRELFGDDSIRTARTHAKWLILRNDTWNLAIRTSMNMNHNPRLENLEISDDPNLCDFLQAIADDIYAEQAPGIFDGELPELPSVPSIPIKTIQAGSIDKSKLTRL